MRDPAFAIHELTAETQNNEQQVAQGFGKPQRQSGGCKTVLHALQHPWGLRFLYYGRPVDRAQEACVVHAPELNLPGRLRRRVRVQVNREGGRVQQPLCHHVEEHGQRPHVRQLRKS